MKPKYFNLPDGKATKSARLYLKEWNKILKPLEKLTGMKVWGFDPSIALIRLEKGVPVQGTTVNIPLWFAKILVEKFQSLNEALFINVYK